MYTPENLFAYQMNNMFIPSSNIVWDGNSVYSNSTEPKIKKIPLPQQNRVISPPVLPPSAFTQISSKNPSDAWKPNITANQPEISNSVTPSTIATSSPKNPSDSKDATTLETEPKQNLYKTELCRNFVETGQCRYSSKCQFAHGQDELRGVLRHPKYKTEICKQYHTGGTCVYGKRCRFIHHADEMRTPEGERMNDSNYSFQRQLAQLKHGNVMPSPNQSLFSFPSEASPIPQQWFNEIEKLMSDVSVSAVLDKRPTSITEEKTNSTLPAELKGVFFNQRRHKIVMIQQKT